MSCFQMSTYPVITLKLSFAEHSSVQFSHSVMSDSLQPYGPQHARPPCPPPIPGVFSNSCPLTRWCHPTISSSVIPFSSRLQSFPVSGSFPRSQFFASSGQSIGVSASVSVLPMNTQDWSPLGWTGWISLQSKGHSRVFSNRQFTRAQLASKKQAREPSSKRRDMLSVIPEYPAQATTISAGRISVEQIHRNKKMLLILI